MPSSDVARNARRAAGDRQAVSIEKLPASIYNELRQLAQRFMRRESPGHTLQPTALVHEAFLRMAGRGSLSVCGETHLRALFAQAMHHILVDHARRRATRKRGGERVRVALDDKLLPAGAEQDLLDLQAVLEKLSSVDAQQVRLVELRIFGGMTVAEAAQELGVSKRTAEREWTAARAWLRRELAALAPHDS
jgi:RNA polymerase sigma factor (TIGR02999 family)